MHLWSKYTICYFFTCINVISLLVISLMFFIFFIVSWWLQYVFIQRNEARFFCRCNATSFEVIPGCLCFSFLYFISFIFIIFRIRNFTHSTETVFSSTLCEWYSIYLFIFSVFIVSSLFFTLLFRFDSNLLFFSLSVHFYFQFIHFSFIGCFFMLLVLCLIVSFYKFSNIHGWLA